MNQNLEDRVASLEDKLASLQAIIEHRLLSKPTPSQPAPQARPAVIAQAVKPTTVSAIGINWMGLLAGLFFVLAAVYLVSLGIESGWLTPVRQLAIAVFFGGALIAVPETLWIRDRAYASILSAAGLAILQLTSFAGYYLLEIYSGAIAFALCSCVSLLSITLFIRHRFGAYVVIGIIGVYGGLFAMHKGSSIEQAGLFLLLWNLLYIALSVKTGLRWILQLAAFCAFLPVALLGWMGSDKQLVLAVQATQFLLFLGATAWTSRRHGDMNAQESWTFLPLLLLYYFHLHHLLESMHKLAAAAFGIGLAALVVALRSVIGKKEIASSASAPMILTFAAITLAHALYLNFFGATERLFAGVVLMLTLPLLARKVPRGSDWVGVWTVFGLLIFWSQISAITDLDEAVPSGLRGLSLLAHGLLILTFLFATGKDAPLNSAGENKLILGVWAHLLTLRAIWIGAEALASQDVIIVATLLSALYALSVLTWSWRAQDEAMARGAVGILALISVKFALWDMTSTSGLVRILVLLGLGTILYVCGLLFRKIQNWKAPVPS